MYYKFILIDNISKNTMVPNKITLKFGCPDFDCPNSRKLTNWSHIGCEYSVMQLTIDGDLECSDCG